MKRLYQHTRYEGNNLKYNTSFNRQHHTTSTKMITYCRDQAPDHTEQMPSTVPPWNKTSGSNGLAVQESCTVGCQGAAYPKKCHYWSSFGKLCSPLSPILLRLNGSDCGHITVSNTLGIANVHPLCITLCSILSCITRIHFNSLRVIVPEFVPQVLL